MYYLNQSHTLLRKIHQLLFITIKKKAKLMRHHELKIRGQQIPILLCQLRSQENLVPSHLRRNQHNFLILVPLKYYIFIGAYIATEDLTLCGNICYQYAFWKATSSNSMIQSQMKSNQRNRYYHLKQFLTIKRKNHTTPCIGKIIIFHKHTHTINQSMLQLTLNKFNLRT